jgi:hypothetical protein
MASDTVTTRAKAPLFVVADTHGEYEIFADMLIKHRVVDGKLHWSFGRGYLVILGDVFDRGAHHTEILWLIYASYLGTKAAGVARPSPGSTSHGWRAAPRYLNPRFSRRRRCSASILIRGSLAPAPCSVNGCAARPRS